MVRFRERELAFDLIVYRSKRQALLELDRRQYILALVHGLSGQVVIRHIGRWYALWFGAFGLSLGALVLLAGRSPAVTIGAAFGMGLIGSLILVIVPSALSDRHGEQRAVALSEANVISSLVATAAPLYCTDEIQTI